jgi:hypothetical protein
MPFQQRSERSIVITRPGPLGARQRQKLSPAQIAGLGAVPGGFVVELCRSGLVVAGGILVMGGECFAGVQGLERPPVEPVTHGGRFGAGEGVDVGGLPNRVLVQRQETGVVQAPQLRVRGRPPGDSAERVAGGFAGVAAGLGCRLGGLVKGNLRGRFVSL